MCIFARVQRRLATTIRLTMVLDDCFLLALRNKVDADIILYRLGVNKNIEEKNDWQKERKTSQRQCRCKGSAAMHDRNAEKKSAPNNQNNMSERAIGHAKREQVRCQSQGATMRPHPKHRLLFSHSQNLRCDCRSPRSFSRFNVGTLENNKIRTRTTQKTRVCIANPVRENFSASPWTRH